MVGNLLGRAPQVEPRIPNITLGEAYASALTVVWARRRGVGVVARTSDMRSEVDADPTAR